MSISASDVAKLRKLTGAGMMDCKKALVESEGDFDRAIQIIREKGQAVANKRADREASEGDVIAKVSADGKYGALIALNCETDFVAKNEDFVKLAHEICDLALATKPANLDALKNTPFKNGKTVEGIITEQIGIIGEKLELACCESLAGEVVCPYIHMGNKLATLVSFNQAGVDKQVYKDVAMQVAAMNPVALTKDDVPASVIENEMTVALEKTKEEQIEKAVEAALKKAGINPAHVDSDEHIESNTAKGWITPEQAQQARDIKAKVSVEAAANLKEQMIQNIAQGRLNKFFKESTLLNQTFIKDNKITVEQMMSAASKGLTCTGFKRYALKD
ncbi:MAG: elongation factor Ts [Salinivirgaceae bacterium]|nr:elongation factor Ts [Salinivirgaceae bacterium]MBO7434285.1 elongation factor Ts [Salinivirgaceae bacterium]MBR5167541.1 elongation factor Ts [Salinivirgaceae bacterium]